MSRETPLQQTRRDQLAASKALAQLGEAANHLNDIGLSTVIVVADETKNHRILGQQVEYVCISEEMDGEEWEKPPNTALEKIRSRALSCVTQLINPSTSVDKVTGFVHKL
jgi:hypothetical protein